MRRRKWLTWSVLSYWLLALGIAGGLVAHFSPPERVAERNIYGVAVMPVEKVEVQVRDLNPLEGGWVVPWSIEVTESGSCWLDAEAVVLPRRMGTADVYVVNGRQGFIVRSYCRDFRWSRVPSRRIDGCYPIWSFSY